ncbi:MAG: tetratricopeptide repeat protein [Geminicoccaceae bacterium]|nr:tetratricopeptide repeat protein [Geminicoccaceae bacterium]
MKSDEFIREVDEELQQERLAALWKRWGALVIGIALAIVLATAGRVGWNAWQESSLQSQGEAMVSAERKFSAGSFDDAADDFASIETDYPGGPAAIAGLRRAAALRAGGDTERAATVLAEVADRHGDDPLIADLARLQGLSLEANSGGDPAMILQSLEPLAAAGRPWRYSALELQVAMALGQGDTERATDILRHLIDDTDTPQGLRGRARELLISLGGDPDATAGPDEAAGAKEAEEEKEGS